jgi:6-phosphogluconolactonase
MNKISGYIGAYTEADFGGKGRGIYSFTLNLENGHLEDLHLQAECTNPSYLCAPLSGKYLYAVNELHEWEGKPGGAVSAYAVEGGGLRLLNQAASEGACPCHIALDPGERFAVVSNYTGGSIAVFPLLHEGGLGKAVQRIALSGHGPNAGRQEGPHAHSFMFAPAGAYGFACDLGADRVMAYTIRGDEPQPLIPADVPWFPVQGGSGPRHGVFHPQGNRCYVLNELDSTVDVLAWDMDRGIFERLGRISALPPDVSGAECDNTSAAIRLDRGGKYLYVSNRGRDSITVFRVEDGGLLAYIGAVSSGGRTPRDIILDPAGAFLIAAHQNSDNLTVFWVDEALGILVKAGEYELPSPVCVLFAQRG